MAREDKEKIGTTLLGLYLSKYQNGAYRQFTDRQGVDMLAPFKFIGLVFTGLGRVFTPKGGKKK